MAGFPIQPNSKVLITSANASGAYQAALAGLAVVIVDVIDMSTTSESALESGALQVFGTSLDDSKAPVPLNPYQIGINAGQAAVAAGTGVIIAAEPRVGCHEERLARLTKVMSGIVAAGGKVEGVVANMGAESFKEVTVAGKVVICASDTGGVAFDAAFNAGGKVVTATIARTRGKKGKQTALAGAERAIAVAGGCRGIAVIAASSNSLEDILAAEYISKTIMELGYLNL